jgi:hypothetical protein
MLFNVNSKMSQLKLMIIFTFYLPLKYPFVLPLELKTHYVNLLMKWIKFFCQQNGQ